MWLPNLVHETLYADSVENKNRRVYISSYFLIVTCCSSYILLYYCLGLTTAIAPGGIPLHPLYPIRRRSPYSLGQSAFITKGVPKRHGNFISSSYGVTYLNDRRSLSPSQCPTAGSSWCNIIFVSWC
jgi:hypothetical protein